MKWCAILIYLCMSVLTIAIAQEVDEEFTVEEVSRMEELSLRNQELLITNEQLRNEVRRNFDRLQKEDDPLDYWLLVIGGGIFLVGLLIGIVLGARNKSSNTWG